MFQGQLNAFVPSRKCATTLIVQITLLSQVESIHEHYDLNLMVNELHLHSKVFQEIPGRKHNSFPNINRNLFAKVDWNDLDEWFQKHKTLFLDIHMDEDQDFI